MPKVSVFAAIFDEQGKILLVKRNYGPKSWTTPGGGMEAGESVLDTLHREVAEEVYLTIKVDELVGVYSTPHIDDLVLLFYAIPLSDRKWTPNEELSDMGYFSADDLPSPLHLRTRTRILDALAHKTGVVRVFTEADQ